MSREAYSDMASSSSRRGEACWASGCPVGTPCRYSGDCNNGLYCTGNLCSRKSGDVRTDRVIRTEDPDDPYSYASRPLPQAGETRKQREEREEREAKEWERWRQRQKEVRERQRDAEKEREESEKDREEEREKNRERWEKEMRERRKEQEKREKEAAEEESSKFVWWNVTTWWR